MGGFHIIWTHIEWKSIPFHSLSHGNEEHQAWKSGRNRLDRSN